MNRLRLLSTIAILCTNFAFGQHADIRGVVVDSLTNEILPFANIRIEGTTRGTVTNLQGFFLIAQVPRGTHTLIVSYVGYKTVEREITVRDTQAVSVRVQLVPESIESEEVVVWGKARAEMTSVNTSLNVLDQADVKLVPVTVQPDVFRSLQILPGISTTNDLSSKFYVRGGAADQNLFLLDGARIYYPFHANAAFGAFDPDMIKAVEVYTGGFPAGYSGRLSSVINITSRDGRQDGMHARGNVNFLTTGASLEGNFGLMEGLTILASGRKSISNAPLKRMFGDNTPIDYYDAFLKFNNNHPDGGRMSVQMFLTEDKLREPNPAAPDYIWKNSAFSLNASTLFGARTYIDVVAYLSKFYSERNPKYSSFVKPASTSVTDAGVRANGTTYSIGDLIYNFGFDFTFPKLEYRIVNQSNQQIHLYNTLIESQAWLKLSSARDSFKYDVGLNFDIGSTLQRGFSKSSLQPRLNLSYLHYDSIRVKFSYGRYSQNMITVSNEDEIFSIFEAWVAIPEDLETNVADHFVLGADIPAFRWLSFSTTGYYKNYLSLVSYNSEKVDADDPDYINGSGDAYGFEFSSQARISQLNLFASYALGWTHITSGPITYSPRYDRRHTIKLLAVYDIARDLSAHIRWDFGSGLPFTETVGYYDRLHFTDITFENDHGETGTPYARLGKKNSARLPSVNRLDIGINYDFTVLGFTGTVGAAITNLLNAKNLLYFDRKTGHRAHMTPFMPTATLTLEH